MNVMVVARDIKVHPALREQVEDLSAGLSRFFHDLRRVAWHLQIEADLVRVSCSVAARSGDYRAQAKHHTAESALGLVYDKLVTQRRRVKMKRLGARKSGGTEGRAPQARAAG